MIFDLLVFALIILAFIAGFQRGVLKVFSLLLAVFLAGLLLIWILPYYTEFFYASLSQTYQAYYEVGTLLFFTILSLGFLLLLRLLWRERSSDHHLWIQKSLGGLTMVILMLSTIVTLSGFCQQANLLKQKHVQNSRARALLEPMHALGSKIYTKLVESKDRFRDGHSHATH